MIEPSFCQPQKALQILYVAKLNYAEWKPANWICGGGCVANLKARAICRERGRRGIQLATERPLAAQLDAETSALASARHTLDIANDRYKAGIRLP